jgi:RNA polymerase sigma-70 factor (ECF subfamily)
MAPPPPLWSDRIGSGPRSPAAEAAREGVKELVQRVQRGDTDAFEPLYQSHIGRVYALCLRMSGDVVAARELAQDVFVHAWERIGTFRGESAFGSWLHRLAVNVVLMDARSAKSRAAFAGDRVEAENLDELPVAAMPRSDDERMDLEQAIAALPARARQVFVLHDVEGYRHDEIAALMDIAAGTVRAQLFRARQLLMEALS